MKGVQADGKEGPENWAKFKLAQEAVEPLRAMLEAASSAGVEVNSNIGLRDLEGQWRVWHNAGHPKDTSFVAHPGTSNHGTGRAIDFHAGFDWLLANAGRYGWINLPMERWHYDFYTTPGAIEQHRKLAEKKSTKRKQVMGGTAKKITAENAELFSNNPTELKKLI